jgi:hypothetical protein
MNFSTSDKYANNPQAFLNGYISGMRNVFLTTTVGVAVYGFSKGFLDKKSDSIMRMLSLMIYIFAFCYLINTNTLFRKYLNKVQFTNMEKDLPNYISLSHWRNYENLAWVYCIILIFIISLASQRFVKNLFE